MATAASTPLPLPDSMVAVGDSITQAASTAGSLGSDAPQNSWSTGTSSAVNSHYLRLLALGAPISGANHNRSVSGAKMAGLAAQMQTAAALQPDYVTVLMGGNDLCTDTAGQMTTVANFGTQFQAAMATLATASPSTNVLVVSIPDVYQLWNLFKNNFFARLIWATAGICQSLLANPGSTQAADVQRRAAVRQRNVDYNAQLAAICAQFDRCLFDGNAAFNTVFTTGDVSGDYFHPSVQGQAKLAAVSWAAGYTWTATPPPPVNQAPVAGFGVSCVNLACSFTDGSTDDVAVVTRSWSFGDGGSSTAQNPSRTYAAAGTYTVTLTVTDGGGLRDDVSKQVTVSAAVPATMTVESLTGQALAAGRNNWTATVSILVSGPDGRGVPGATVSGTWTVGAADTCMTGADGRCSVASDSLNKKASSVTFTVTGVTHASLAYQPSLTSITVRRP
ncbi:MAG TPA: GDSL-type esterase/lipase family protein [Candidatus Limnocylindrales bacterium]|nr:GDSL-type esterase/lipase family protein [Candidatus Limnocylindrales bacterium]